MDANRGADATIHEIRQLNNYNFAIILEDVDGIRFEWDEAKNLANQRKHGVDFDQASQVFLDPLHFSVPDRVVHGEERWQTFGLVKHFAILIVIHTVREYSAEQGVEIVRIISAREATRKERVFYEEENG